jgi:ribose transport system substrate-binding protein
MRALGTLALALALAASCSSNREPRPQIIYIPKMTDDSTTFWATVKEGVLSAAADQDVAVEVRGAPEETQVDEQIALVERAIHDRPAGLLLAADDFLRLIPAVRQAVAAGIPVVTVDSSVATDDPAAKIGTDNRQLGRTAGAALLRLVPKGSVVAVVSYIKASSTARDREEGLTEALTGSVALLPTLYSESDEQTAYRLAGRLLAAHHELKGLVALNEPSTVGVCRALAESGRQNDVSLVGVDASFEVLKSLESGVLKAVLVQQPFNMGYLGIETVAKLIRGKTILKAVDTGSVEITRATMFLPQNEKLLFPLTVLKSAHSVPKP